MRLIEGWKRKFPKLWSVRLSILAAAASSIEVGFNFYATGQAPTLVIAAAFISLGAAAARIVAQPGVVDD